MSTISLLPSEAIENINRVGNSDNINIKKVYSQIFKLKQKLPKNLLIENEKEFNLKDYIEFKKEILQRRINISHIDFLSKLSEIKKNSI